jgi:hypothetical protein
LFVPHKKRKTTQEKKAIFIRKTIVNGSLVAHLIGTTGKQQNHFIHLMDNKTLETPQLNGI